MCRMHGTPFASRLADVHVLMALCVLPLGYGLRGCGCAAVHRTLTHIRSLISAAPAEPCRAPARGPGAPGTQPPPRRCYIVSNTAMLSNTDAFLLPASHSRTPLPPVLFLV